MRKELKEVPDNPHLEKTIEEIEEVRSKVVEHDVYHELDTLDDLRVFMEHHIYAVWDFMSLLKALQRELTCVSTPWIPESDGLSRHLVNDIVLEEESDKNPEGGFNSHFEMHIESMKELGADTEGIENVIDSVSRGEEIGDALSQPGVPEAAREFVDSTWSVVSTREPHRIGAAFTFGREDLIPDMFHSHVEELHEENEELDLYYYYLERHMELDEEEHGPMALRMITNLCGDDEARWREAREAAVTELESRKQLWDAVEDKIQS